MTMFTLNEAQRLFLERKQVVMTDTQRATLSDLLRSQGHDEGRVALVLDLLSHRDAFVAVRDVRTYTSVLWPYAEVAEAKWQLRGYVGDVLRGGGEVTTLVTIDESAV